MINKYTNIKGITLIALIITIIILLILVSVSIVTLTGENGIISKAKESKSKTEIAGIIEKIKLDILEIQTENGIGNLTEESLKIILGKYFDNVPEKLPNDLSELELVTKDEYGGYKIKGSDIYSGITQMETEEISAIDIAKETDKSKYYGATITGYTCPNSEAINHWNLFYADENNIYMIADDYIPYDACPSSATQKIFKNSNYSLSMNQVISDYTGSTNITNTKIQALNKNYFAYLKANNVTSTTNNMKAVAYMLDTNIWNVYQGEKAEYAIGGPSIELLFKSHNEKYGTNYQTKVDSINGYQISKDGGTNWKTYYEEEMLNTSDRLYVISSREKTNAMWIASPSAYNNKTVFNVNYFGYGYCNDSSYQNVGFRPLVCLSSKVILEKTAEKTYRIK